MKKYGKIVSLVMALTLISSTLAACGGDKKSSSDPAVTTKAAVGDATTATPTGGKSWEKDTTPITFDWYVNETWFDCPEGNMALTAIKEQTGIDVNFIVPVDAAQQMNTMIASDTLTDLVTMGWYDGNVPLLSTPQYAYALNELADQYDPSFYDVVDKDVLNWFKQTDGNTYGYPCNATSPADLDRGLLTNRTFLVRKDIYEAIGKPDMRTPDGFLKALADAKAHTPTIDNGASLIPYGTFQFGPTGNTGFEDMLLEFLNVPRELDDKFYPVNKGNPSPEYITWLKTFRKANEQGLLATDIYIDGREQIEEKIQQGRYFALLYQAQDAMNPLGNLYKNNPDQIYMAVDGPANSKLDTAKLGVSGYSGWELTMISKKCKAPERAISLMTWGYTDDAGQRALYVGKEGETFDMVDGVAKIKPEVDAMKTSDFPNFKKQYNLYNEIWMFAKTANVIAWEPEPTAPFDQYKEWKKGKSGFYGQYDNVEPPADSDEGDTAAKVANKWGEILPKLLQAKDDAEFDKIWADFEKYKTDNDYDKYLEFVRGKVAENKAKLGM